ncbi:MAG: hydantoinase/oxoprolinase family protein, partial [Rhodospirillaceae bacterium]|nr:hydantoinase/oxoprolinase family protein [Rhodospirillaceae bacterium]
LSTLIDPAGRKAKLADAQTSRRQVYFDGNWHDTPVYWRDHLPADLHLVGPAIVEQMDCTTVIEPADLAESDAEGNIIITIGGAQ